MSEETERIKLVLQGDIVRILTNRFERYGAHWAQREKITPELPHIDFTEPYRSPVELYVETDAARLDPEGWRFDSAIWHLLTDKKILCVTRAGHSSMYNDFYLANVGDLFLNVPILARVYAECLNQLKGMEP